MEWNVLKTIAQSDNNSNAPGRFVFLGTKMFVRLNSLRLVIDQTERNCTGRILDYGEGGKMVDGGVGQVKFYPYKNGVWKKF